MSLKEPYRPPLYTRFTRPLLKVIARPIFHLLADVHIQGTEHVPSQGAYIVAANHISIYDPPFILAFWPHILETIGAEVVFRRPGQGQLLRLYGTIPVHRNGYDHELLERMIDLLRQGRRVMIAPEGQRSHQVAMQRARPGIAYVVEKSGAPVIPVGVVGTTPDLWQRMRRGERPRLELRIGRPLILPPLEGKGEARRAARQQNADLVMRHIAGLLPQEYHGYYAGQAIPPASQADQ
jgi:1-acyl-sn-glycerol-3-phosphate acyltransferase